MSINRWVRPNIVAMTGYTPGEQPKMASQPIKLNTNENPYPPPNVVLQAISLAVGENLRLYPDQTSRPVREAAAMAYQLNADQVVVGNGSDDLLTMIMRTFVHDGELVATPEPTYTLYRPLTYLQAGRYQGVPWLSGWHLPVEALAALGAKVILVARPNAPTGHAIPLEEVARLCEQTTGIVVLDEAYVDFCRDNGLSLLAQHDNLILTRSFSKSLCLAGARIGLGFMTQKLAQQLHKVRDSYNLDTLAQAAATAALTHLEAYVPLTLAICQQRERITQALRQRGFLVQESQANFVLATIPPGRRDGHNWMADLKRQNVYIRYFGDEPFLQDKLRITIGTPEQMAIFLTTIDQLLSDN
ncbi:MAG: histidinol-phosphate transaminase [Magnetococcus sp. DMHC-6]